MAGCDVQLRFSGQEKGIHAQAVQAHGRVGKCLVAVGAGESMKNSKNFLKTCENVLTIDNIYTII